MKKFLVFVLYIVGVSGAFAQDCADLASRLEFASGAAGGSLATLNDPQLADKVVDSLQPLQSAVGSENFSKVMAHLADQSASGKLEINQDFILSLDPQFHNTLFARTQPMLKNLDRLFAENSRAAVYPHLQAKFLEKVESQKKVEEVQVKVEEHIRIDDKYKVFEDASGLVYYEFDETKRKHEDAIKFCEDKGMRLPTKEEFDVLSTELQADSTKPKNWLGDKIRFWVWSSSVSSFDRNVAWYFGAVAYGSVGVSYGDRADGTGVRCVGQ